VAACEAKCDAQAAAAPGTGKTPCDGVDYGSGSCYLKSACGGTAGACESGECGYRAVSAAPGPPPPGPPLPPVPPSPPGVTLRAAAERHAGRDKSDCHLRKTATEYVYDSKPVVKWLSCTAKRHSDIITLGTGF
jgi:hypothetical protein